MSDNSIKILMIEDNPGDSRLIQEMLKESGRGLYSVDCADRLSKALKYLAKQNPDIILLDMGLPDSQGLDTLTTVLGSSAGRPIIVLTGRDDERLGIEAVRHGAQDYLIKGQIFGKATSLIRVISYSLERQELYKALRDSEENYRHSLDESPLGIRIVSADGELHYANRAALDIYGFDSIEELKSTPTRERYTPESYAEFQLRRDKRQRGEYVPSNYEISIVRKDGEIRHLMVSRKEVLWNSKPQFQVLYNDITERKQAEEAIKRSKAQLEEAQHVAHIGHWELSDMAGAPRWSQEIFNIFGIDPARGEPSFTAHRDLLHTDDWDILNNAVSKIFSEGGTFDIQFRTLLPDKSLRWMHALGYTRRNHDGVTVGIFGTAQDITQYKEALESLKVSEIKYKMLFDTLPIGVTVSDKVGNIKESNKEAEQLLGLSQEIHTQRQIDGQEWQIVRTNGSRMPADEYASVRALKDNRVIADVEMGIVKGEGVITWISVTAAPIPLPDYGVVIAYNDITDSKRLGEEQQRVTKLESIGILAGGIAHDFNNILTAILGNISLAKIKTDPGSELRDSLEKAEKASFRAKDLTQQLLTFSKGGAPVKKLASLSEMLKDTADFALRGSTVKCQFSISNNLWHAVIDAGQISQVINNLVINAQQAMPNGGTIKLSAENMILTEEQSLGKRLPLQKGNYIRIAVSDQGTGIQEAHLDKIFDPFFTTKQTGSGLGLATSFSIVRNHGGHISVESKLGIGSTFYIYLPASTKTEKTEITDNKDKKTTLLGNARIMVMDDEETVRGVAGEMLKYLGVKDIEFAANGADAIKLYTEAMQTGKPFDAVILDITIPGGMGGKETIKKLLEIEPTVKAIVSSGYSGELAISEYKECGFSGVVAKPYTIEQFQEALHDLIG